MATTPTDPQSPDGDPGDTVSYINPLTNLLSGIYVLNPVHEEEYAEAHEALSQLQEALSQLVVELTAGPLPTRDLSEALRRLFAAVQVISDFHQILSSSLVIAFSAGGALADTVSTSFGALLPRSALQEIAERSSSTERKLRLTTIRTKEFDEGTQLVDRLKNALQRIERTYFPRLLDSLVALQGRPDEFDLDLAPRLREGVQRRAGVVAAQSAQAARNSAVHASTASGKAATNRQIRTFETLGQEERRAARFWTTCAFALIAVGVVVPLAILPLEFSIPSVDGPVAVALKLIVALPIFGGAAYSARIAAGHREHARNLRLTATQVDTLEAFIEPMDEASRNDTRALLARRIFTTTGDLTSPPADTISVIPAELIPLLERVVDKAERGKLK